MKIKIKLQPREFVCKSGRIKAQGKAARTPFCYRLKVTANKTTGTRTTMVELHSNITGRKIGYIGKGIDIPVAVRKEDAHAWAEFSGINTPEHIEKKVKHFLKTAQGIKVEPLMKHGTPQYEKMSKKVFDHLVREAKKK